MTAHSRLQDEARRDGAAHGGTAGTQLLALTHDSLLAHAVGELAGDGVMVQVFAELRLLADELMQHGNAVVLVDAQALQVATDAAVDSLKAQFPDITLLVAGHAAEHTLLTSRIAQHQVFRFVHKPASPQRLKLYLDAARAPGARVATGETGVHRALPPRRGGMAPALIAGAVALAVLLAAGAWWLFGRDEAGSDGDEPAAAIADPAPAPDVTAQLARADAAFAAGNFVATDGSSAAELYREAMRFDARNATAADGLERAVEGALGNAEQALLAGDLAQAQQRADAVRAIVPANARLAFLQAQIDRESTRLTADASQRQAFDARQAQIRSAVNVVSARIRSGALLDPATDSALSRYSEAQRIGSGDPLVRGSRDALVAALLTAADRDARAGRTAAARRFVDAAASLNATAPGLDVVRRRLEEAAATSATAPAPAPAIAGGATPVLDEPPASPVTGAGAEVPVIVGTPAATPARNVVSAATLRTLRRYDPVYPPQALAELTSGWVELEFTITLEGAVKDVVVTASEPGSTFDAAAIAAMRRYRYEPMRVAGTPVEQRARLRMRFTAQEQ